MTAAENVVEVMTGQLLKKEAELTKLRQQLQAAKLDVARLQGCLSATRVELKAANDKLEELLYGSDEHDEPALAPNEVFAVGR